MSANSQRSPIALPELCWYDISPAVAAIKVLGHPETLCQSHLDDFLSEVHDA